MRGTAYAGPRKVVLYMLTQTRISPTAKEMTKLPPKQREEINWYHEQGMPAQGIVTSALRRVVKVRKERT